MLKTLKNYLFSIGAFIFSITLLVKHLFSIEGSGFVLFLIGFACGLELVGIVILIKNKRTL
jgi:uncharacterized membrane protein YhaH (DUF805 family)